MENELKGEHVKMAKQRIEVLFDDAKRAHKEFDYYFRRGMIVLIVTLLMGASSVACLMIGQVGLANLFAGAGVISGFAVWSLMIPKDEALKRADRALKEAEAILDWVRRKHRE